METVLITGASRGIGLALTTRFLNSGYRVIATYRGELTNALEQLSSNERLTTQTLEVTDEASVSTLATSLRDVRIDILINNAGIIGPDSQGLDDIDVEGWVRTFTVNTVSPLLVTRALLPNLKQSEAPRILTVSSLMASLEGKGTGMYAYRSSKTAVNKVMQVLALELKDAGVVVCPIHPGWVQTDMGGEEADITVEESAKGIVSIAQRVTIENTGTFYNWDGETIAW